MACLKRRGKVYYAQYYIDGQQKRINLNTSSLPAAKDRLRQIESSLYREEEILLPTRTPIAVIVEKYIEYTKGRKSPGSIDRECYYLRQTFGEITPSLQLKNPKISVNGIKRKASKPTPPIQASYFENISTADISDFISSRVRRQALAPKTANHYREILTRLFNWAMTQGGIRMPKDRNPAAQVERYRENASEIRFLSLDQIEYQINCHINYPALQAIVAVLIYAGLRRAELCWLKHEDVDLSSGDYGMIRVRAKTVEGERWQPKTRINRAVPISSKLRSILDKYNCPKGEWFFCSPEGHHWDPDNLSRYLRGKNVLAGLPWGCLDYRHTFGSHLAMKGESLYKISKLMGNSPEICRKHYAALIPESLVGSVEF
ncbi:MAG: hypothetical protein A2076_06660 [Geobacteraceae bacterium GWC2_53_11]|nr:MAG: hypothetical protein A2076_06660 [Geobacteraceae bacterium GWC2_53_11]